MVAVGTISQAGHLRAGLGCGWACWGTLPRLSSGGRGPHPWPSTRLLMSAPEPVSSGPRSQSTNERGCRAFWALVPEAVHLHCVRSEELSPTHIQAEEVRLCHLKGVSQYSMFCDTNFVNDIFNILHFPVICCQCRHKFDFDMSL